MGIGYADDLKVRTEGGLSGAPQRDRDWPTIPLGMPARWQQSLRAAVKLMLSTGHPVDFLRA